MALVEVDPEEESVLCDELVCELEFDPKLLLEVPPKEDVWENTPELFTPLFPKLDPLFPKLDPPKLEPPKLDPLELPKELPKDEPPAGPFMAPAGVAPGMVPPPKLPPSCSPGSPKWSSLKSFPVSGSL